MEVGAEVFIVGAPYGMSYTLTVGHISARHEPYTIPGALLGEFFQTDAAINEGNSGGPMFNMKGEVIGIVSHILSKSGGFEGLGFATTSNTANELLLGKKPFWAGVEGTILTGILAKALNLPQSTGMLIQQVAEDSPAGRIGLRGGVVPVTIDNKSMIIGGDIVLEVMGISFAESGSYLKIREALHELPEDATVTMKILRWGEIKELSGRIER